MRLQDIDWAQPWLAPYRVRGECIASRAASVGVAQALNEAAAASPVQLPAGLLRFAPQQSLPQGHAYEAFIADTACVPTRDNLHDFFNGLVWLHWPQLKARLNAAQAGEIAHRGIGAVRGPARDALTLFDENGALLHAPEALVESLQARDWQGLFLTRRPLWREARLWLFGHALLEKLSQPRPAVTAHVLLADAQGQPLSDIAKPFLPLPVLGVPGWWPGNGRPGFYANERVFRPYAKQCH